MTQFTFESKPSLKEVAARFIRAHKNLEVDRQDMVAHLKGRYLVILRSAAPKKTGRFAEGITTDSFQRGNVYGFTASTPQPLGTWLRPPGTKPHIIRPVRAKMLRFEVAGKVVFARLVNHPGYQPQSDFVKEATDQFMPEARESLRRISKRYVATVTT